MIIKDSMYFVEMVKGEVEIYSIIGMANGITQVWMIRYTCIENLLLKTWIYFMNGFLKVDLFFSLKFCNLLFLWFIQNNLWLHFCANWLLILIKHCRSLVDMKAKKTLLSHLMKTNFTKNYTQKKYQNHSPYF